MTPPMAASTVSRHEERNIVFADHTRAMEAANRQMSRWTNLLDRLAQE
ncbi:hypothetical protein D806_015970 [Mycolicibacterium smegmatis MKD8]|uniref:Uncharacterized protein n=1 Tax=Mycolicibacterium smegmatis (strain MKD8) TaxID=1214915 RepID=A0A2U9PLG3_MYCSE|nr:hypothetical protein D806_015970 [Mycolicibacterium smegmatis MKD8]